MRDLNECKAEIFSRSEKAIKEREKKRKRILYGVLPVLICIGICTAVFFPNMPFLKSKDSEIANGSENPEVGAESGNSGVLLTVESDGAELNRITDEGKMREIYSDILSLYEDGNFTYESADGSSSGTLGAFPEAYGNSRACEYVLTFSLDDEKEVFVFREGSLCRESTGEWAAVSEEELKKIIDF